MLNNNDVVVDYKESVGMRKLTYFMLVEYYC